MDSSTSNQKETCNFYPDIRAYLSPSSFAMWGSTKSGFAKTYFEGDRFEGNEYTESGRMIHALIEGGFIKVVSRFENNEIDIEIDLTDLKQNGVRFKGRPDSFELDKEISRARFVDYKSGLENEWTDQDLCADMKMRATAWLVWQYTGEPEEVLGSIEYIPTRFNAETKEIEPTGEASKVVATYAYTAKDLRNFGDVIVKTIAEVNAGYLRFLASSEEFISSEDVAEFAELSKQIKELEAKAEAIKTRIADQMDFGYKDSVALDVGTFYFSTRRTFAPPKDMLFRVGEKIYTLAEAAEIAKRAKMAMTEWEIINEPASTSRSLGFKAKK